MKVAFVYDIVWSLVTVIGKEVLAAKEVSVMEVDGGQFEEVKEWKTDGQFGLAMQYMRNRFGKKYDDWTIKKVYRKNTKQIIFQVQG